MKFRGLGRVQGALRGIDQWRMVRNGGPRCVILMYHRIGPDVGSPYGTTVSQAHFEQHLALLQSLFVPISLEECLRAAARNALPHRSVVVTFDDGYLDNLTSAAPLLQKYSVPVTAFIAGDESTDLTFWWDRLEQVCLGSHPLPTVLSLETGGGPIFRWEAGCASDGEEVGAAAAWQLGQIAPPTGRHRLFQALYTLLVRRSAGEQESILSVLEEWAGCGPVPEETRRMTGDEIARFGAYDGVRIGGHTAHHYALEFFTRDTIRREVRNNLLYLSDLVNRPVRTFAYPYGLYDPVVTSCVAQEGIEAACTSERGCVWKGTRPLLLPRMHVPDEEGATLASRLDRYFG